MTIITSIIDFIAVLLVLAGSILAFSAAIGLIRFRDTLSRLHAVSKPQTLGLVLTITGTILHILVSEHLTQAAKGDLGMLLLIILFALITAPVVAQRVGRLARKEHLYAENSFSRNDMEGLD